MRQEDRGLPGRLRSETIESESPAKLNSRFGKRLSTGFKGAEEAKESVRHASVALHLDRDALGFQAARISFSFIAERIALSRENESRRQIAQVGGHRRRGQRLRLVLFAP